MMVRRAINTIGEGGICTMYVWYSPGNVALTRILCRVASST